MALGWLFIWLGGFSVAAPENRSCYETKTAGSGCAGIDGACCCEDGSNLPSEPANAVPVTTPQWLPTIPSISEVSKLLCDPPRLLSNTMPHGQEDKLLIPAELRLGSALWSHAPPTQIA
jgi:hypothetical protein